MSQNNLDFPTTEEYTKKDVKKVQKRLLEMAIAITNILDKNHIKYFMASGTLIGAVRHQGFIPWDDDFDIFLFDDEYTKAIELLRENLPKDMIVLDQKSDPHYCPDWAKVRDLNSRVTSKLFPRDNLFKYHGISLDLLRIKQIPKKDIAKNKFKEILNYNDRLHNNGIITKKEYLQQKLKSLPKYLKASLKSTFSNNNTPIHWSIIDYSNTGVDSECILPLRKYRFENTDFWGPNDADKFLIARYGDYMEIPEYKDRKVHYSEVQFLPPKSHT